MTAIPGTASTWDELDFGNNCSAVGAYVAWIVTGNREPPFPVVAGFWRAVAPDANSTTPSNSHVIDWHEWARSNRTDLASQTNGIPFCRSELCQAVGPEVDGSLAGYGLLASYGLEAVLLTLYCSFAAFSYFGRSKSTARISEKQHDGPSDTELGLLGRLAEAFKGTTYDLFIAAAFLAFGIQATVIYYQTASVTFRYNSSLQLIISAFTFYSLAAMLPLILNSFRRGWSKGAILICLFVIHTVAWVLCTNSAQDEYYHNESVIEICPQNHPSLAAVQAAMFTLAAMIWMPPLFGLCLSFVLCFFRCNNRRMWQAAWLKKVANVATVLYAAANFICMWGVLIFLAVFFSGASWGTEDVWNLGQALTLTPWIPVLVEIASVLRFGSETGFVGRLPREYRVVRKEKVLHQQEGDAFLDGTGIKGANQI
ncbi:hypothetical protein CCHL11_07118 [Colletotrichum chlorophyti]|uniref:Uncharacterized protein n=1 Tax=Colletotrichum chlorophyti TaxID=708187 RepID=A0A1Q8S3F7_9PEZI|nr:hypothetical protein CCHL11_07118 [Colletotrichum chlorophyti]